MDPITKACFLCVAASDSSDEAKAASDFVCAGQNDQITLQNAIAEADRQRKDLFLFDGLYSIDAFTDHHDGGPMSALVFPQNHREMKLIGQNKTFITPESWKNGVILYVSEAAFDGVTDSVAVIRSTWADSGLFMGTCLVLENIAVIVHTNRHPMRCFDFRRTWNTAAKNLRASATGESMQTVPAPLPSVPAKGCIGVTLTDGSNNAGNNFENIFALGFDEAIQVGGEHPVLINCAGCMSNYGFTFGNYPYTCAQNHPITLINCCDEENVNMPFFGTCGDKGGLIPGGQEVRFISYNLERVEAYTPGGKLGDAMREAVPGTWCGSIEVTVQPEWNAVNIPDAKLWEDGCGTRFLTRNSLHKPVASSEERRSYRPTYGQQLFDTDIGKLLICTDPAVPTWQDANGNIVE